MHQAERKKHILDILSRRPLASVDELVDSLGVSAATIRRDLNRLSEAGEIERVHGGAQKAPSSLHLRGSPFADNLTVNVPQKKAIAELAASLVSPSETIILDAGTTTYFMCPHLRGRDLQILTNSLPVVNELYKDPTVRLHVPGGQIYPEQDIILSPFRDDATGNYAASKMFMGAHGLWRQGLVQEDSILIQAERRLLDRTEDLIVVADSSKVRPSDGLVLCGLDRIDTLVTDEALEPDAKAILEAAGVDVLIAKLG